MLHKISCNVEVVFIDVTLSVDGFSSSYYFLRSRGLGEWRYVHNLEWVHVFLRRAWGNYPCAEFVIYLYPFVPCSLSVIGKQMLLYQGFQPEWPIFYIWSLFYALKNIYIRIRHIWCIYGSLYISASLTDIYYLFKGLHPNQQRLQYHYMFSI